MPSIRFRRVIGLGLGEGHVDAQLFENLGDAGKSANLVVGIEVEVDVLVVVEVFLSGEPAEGSGKHLIFFNKIIVMLEKLK